VESAAFLAGLEHSRAAEIRALVRRIESAFPELDTEIKWNAPSFTRAGNHLVTLRLFPDPALQVVLHRGAKKLPAGTDLRFDVEGVPHRWADPTRCVLTLGSTDDVDAVIEAIARWLAQPE
jgi:hypothetical protein